MVVVINFSEVTLSKEILMAIGNHYRGVYEVLNLSIPPAANFQGMYHQVHDMINTIIAYPSVQSYSVLVLWPQNVDPILTAYFQRQYHIEQAIFPSLVSLAWKSRTEFTIVEFHIF